MKVMLVGGGSGGHFYPLIAVAEAIRAREPNADLIYIAPEPYNRDILKDNNIRYTYCPAGKVRRYFSLLNLLDAFKSFAGLVIALIKLYVIFPDVVFSKGSFASVPVLLAARWYRIPVVIHESDSKPGRANLLARKFARYIGIAYADVAEYFPKEKTALIGIPLRQAVRQPVSNPHASLGLPIDKPLIYVTGGSLGSEKINDLILKSLDSLLPYYTIFHQTGPTHEERVTKTSQALLGKNELLNWYFVAGTVPGEAVSALLEAAKLVITRAGSTTLFEIALHGKPAIIIPIPEEVSHDQRTNAYSFARYGSSSVLEEGNLTENLLVAEIRSIMDDPARYTRMEAAARAIAAPEAANTLAEAILTICYEHR